MAARNTEATQPQRRAAMSSRSFIAVPSLPERLRCRGMPLGEGLHHRVHRAGRQTLGLQLLELGLRHVRADLAKARVLLRRQLDRLPPTVEEGFLARRVESVPGLPDFLFDAGDR